jgi:hypothetical protein
MIDVDDTVFAVRGEMEASRAFSTLASLLVVGFAVRAIETHLAIS